MALLDDGSSGIDLAHLFRVIAALVTLMTAVVVGAPQIARVYRRLFAPIEIKPSERLFYDNSATRDEIRAAVTNRADEPLYVVRARARSTYPLATIIRRHLMHPTLRPRLYPNIRWGVHTFDMAAEDKQPMPFRLEPGARVQLRHRLKTAPLYKLTTSTHLIEVELSDGRVFRTKRRKVPERWRFRWSHDATA